MSSPSSREIYRRTGLANSSAKPSRFSLVAFAALVLCAGTVLVWLSRPFLGQLASEPTATAGSGVGGSESKATPQGGAGAAGPQVGADRARHAGGEGPQSASATTNLQILLGEAAAITRADRQGSANNLSDETSPPDNEFDEALADEPMLLPIAGWVLDQDGAPVAGIEITASARRLARTDKSGGSAGRANSTLSDELGYFAFGDLPDGEYLLTTESTDDFNSARAVVRTGVGSVVLRVTRESRKRVRIQGKVSDDENQPIAGARISSTDEAQATTSDSGGFYELVLTVDGESRTRSIRFTKPGYHDWTLNVRQTELRDATQWHLDAQLQAEGQGVPVDGTVLDANGDPVSGAQVQLSSHRLQRSYRAVSAADGSFFMDDVDVGNDYRLWVRPTADYRDHVDEGLQVGSGGAFLPVRLEPLGTGSLRGRMVNALLEPIPRYTLWMWNGGAGANRSLAVTSDFGGGYRVEDVPAGEVAFGSRGQPQFTVAGITLEPERTITADLVLDWGHAELTGRVVSSDGDPLAGAEVRLLWSDEEQGVTSRSQRRTVADGEGYFVFTELGPGPHTVSVTASGHQAARLEAMPGDEILIELQETAS